LVPTLLLTGAGTFNLNQAGNDVAVLSANVSGAVTYQDATALTVGAIGAVTGIQTNNNNLTLNVGGSLRVEQPMNVGAGNAIVLNVGLQTSTATSVLAQFTSAAIVTASATTLTGRAGGSDTLQAASLNNLWNVTTPGGGSLADTAFANPVAFAQFENLRGGTSDDTFLYGGTGAIAGLVDGDLGFDVLNVSGVSGSSLTTTGPGTLDGFKGTGGP